MHVLPLRCVLDGGQPCRCPAPGSGAARPAAAGPISGPVAGQATRLATRLALLAAVLLVGSGSVAAQRPSQRPQQQPAPAPAPTRAELERAVAEWLGADWRDERLRQRAVAAVLDGEDGLRWFGDELRAAAPNSRRRTGLEVLGRRVVVGFVDRARRSGVVFRGQYDPLQALQPFATDALFELLLESPAWFSHARRVELVPALRDLQPAAPAAGELEGVIALIEDREVEPADLRLALACMCHQWGRPEFVARELTALRRASAEGDAEDRVLAFQALANLHYRIGEHERAAATHRALAAMADAAGIGLSPTEWYWSACYHALSGDVDRGLAALERCVAVQTDPGTDTSLHLPRSLFLTDPELAALRGDPRFDAAVARAFPAAGGRTDKDPEAGADLRRDR